MQGPMYGSQPHLGPYTQPSMRQAPVPGMPPVDTPPFYQPTGKGNYLRQPLNSPLESPPPMMNMKKPPTNSAGI